ncbi:MAG: YihY/virulence factor BrkB family protein [Planctomycetes bacterium]|jgi:membrane protein|nr:YihY/virulence factor BrkB family protein [Planctomycetota bacterium]
MRTLKTLLTTPAAELGRAGRFLVFQYRLWPHCLRLLRKNNAAQLAAALSYYTIFGLVPLAIVMVLVFHAVPAYRETGDQLKRIIYYELRLTQIEYPDPDHPEQSIALTDYLDEIIERFFTNLDKGSLGLVSAVLVIWAALHLLSIIESAFNRMWYVPRGRRFLHRIISYWALLTLAPLLLAAAVYVTTQYAVLKSIGADVLATVGPLISFGLSLVALFLLYLVMPNAKVQTRAALWGALAAALVWSVARWGFGIYVTKLIPYNTTYGILGLIPLGVFWIFVTWIIVLFGLQLTFTTQHLETLETAETLKAKEAEGRLIANDMTALTIMREVAVAFESGQTPVSLEDVCSRLALPGELGQKLVEQLISRGLLARTREPTAGLTLNRDPARIPLSDIADTIANAAFAQPQPTLQPRLHDLVQAQRALLAPHTLREVLDISGAPGAGTPPPAEDTPREGRAS